MPPAEQATTPTSFLLVFAIWAAGLGAAAQFAKVASVFSHVGAMYPDAGYALGFALSIVGFVGIALGVVAGLFVTRFGCKPLLCGALGLGAAMSAYQATEPTLAYFLSSRLIEGLSHLAIVVTAPTLIAQHSAVQHRGFTMTLWGSFFGIGFSLVTLLGVPLVEANGLSQLFAAHAIYMLLSAIVLWFLLPADIKPTGPQASLSLSAIVREHLLIYRSPTLSAPAIGWLFYTFTFVALLTLLPNYVSAESRSLVAAAMPVASIVVSLTLGVFLLKHLSAVSTIQLGFLLASAILAALWVYPGQPQLCISLAGALGLIQGASFAAIPQLNSTSDAQARANGAIAQTGNLGTTLGTPCLLLMTNTLGFDGLVLFALTFYALGIAAHALLAKRRQVLRSVS